MIVISSLQDQIYQMRYDDISALIANTRCPHLWFAKCGHCGATGDDAHNDKFCPMLLSQNSRPGSGLMRLLHFGVSTFLL
ncbi:hypothetical protein KIN20_029241 [Parelaphostrongylus tenuis]|uniref:Nanos-type domain-containing protein n=1 Tax=Parelaphostrongylus tenuis TaxID=148309 RepID=A0AAD5WFG3_PARTN|nr:hypothetical protein KIN20_029241 [Parelaphostrongylus tenuis]